MRSPSACERVAPIAIAAAIALVAPPASADPKKVCSDAYEQTQSLRKDGRLKAARERAAICTKDACAEFIRSDCRRWLDEIEASQPTIVLEVRDRSGKEVSAAEVRLDGRPWLTRIGVQGEAIDPGTHTLRFTIPGEAPIERTVVVREGEKNEKVAVSFAPAAPPGPAASLVVAAPAPVVVQDAPEDETPIAPWVIGGAGLAVLATGGILSAVVASEKSTFDDHCDAARRVCDAEGAAAGETGRALGPVATTALVIGVAAVGVSIVWLVAESSDEDGATTATVATGPRASAGGAAWTLEGSFR